MTTTAPAAAEGPARAPATAVWTLQRIRLSEGRADHLLRQPLPLPIVFAAAELFAHMNDADPA